MPNVSTNETFLVTAVTRLLTAGRQVEAQGDPVVFTCAHAPLTEAQRHFLACGEALVRACEEAFAAMLAKGEVPTGPCWVCRAVATDQCDFRYNNSCRRWICPDHHVVEAQHWDTRGWDGVDIRCQEHRNLSFDSRDVVRGSGLPPAPRWEGTGDGFLTTY